MIFSSRRSSLFLPSFARRIASIVIAGLLVGPFLPSAAAQDPAGTTLQDMEVASAAMVSWLVDHGSGRTQHRNGAGLDLRDYPVITHQALEILLVPMYLPVLPEFDGWGNAYDYRLDTVNIFSLETVAIRSLGADGAAEGDIYSPGYTSSGDEDLVFLRGLFLRRPLPAPEEAQAVTLDLVRTVGAAMISWLTDVVSGIEGPAENLRGGSFDLSLYPPITALEMSTFLVPSYLPFIPELDGWGNSFEFFVDTFDPLGPAVLAIRSPGSDGATSGDIYTPGGFPAARDEEDVVWADGFFIRFPEGGRIFSDGFESGDLGTWSATTLP